MDITSLLMLTKYDCTWNVSVRKNKKNIKEWIQIHYPLNIVQDTDKKQTTDLTGTMSQI